jgi:Protein of unknown function (DUF4013)
MNIGKAFSYVLDDPHWIKKVLLATFVMFVPALGQIIVAGWLLDTLRNINAGQPHPIPEWSGDDLARWLGRGVAATVSVMAWIVPCMLVVGIVFGGLQLLGTGITSVLSGENTRNVGATLGPVLLCCTTLLQIVVILIIALGTMVPYIRFAATDRVDVGLEYITNFKLLFAHIGPYLLVVLVILVALLAALVLIAITCGIGALVVVPYLELVVIYLLAGLSRLSVEPASA